MTFLLDMHSLLKRLAVLLAVMLVAVALPASAIVIQIGTVEGDPGDIVRVPVSLETQGNAPAALDFRVLFASQKLVFTGYAIAGDDIVDVAAVEVEPGALSVVVLGGLEDLEDGLLVYLKFEVLSQVERGELINLAGMNASGADTHAAPLSAQIRDGWVFVGVCPVPSAPTGLNVTNGVYTDRVILFWESVPYATRYKVFRSDSASDSPSLIGTTSALFYVDATVARTDASMGAGCSGEGASLAGSVAHHYWLAAYNSCGVSSYTGPVTGSTTARSAPETNPASATTLGTFLVVGLILSALGHLRRSH